MVAPVPAQISKLPRRKLSCPSRRSGPNSRPVNLLQPLFPCSVAPVLCFQQLAASFPKSPGWGVPKHVSLPTHQLAPSSLRQLSALCASALSFAVAVVRCSRRFSCPPLTIFRMNTYEKQEEGVGVVDLVFSTLRSLFRSQRSLCCAFSASASDSRRAQSCRISRSQAGRFGFRGCGWSVGIRPVRCRNTAAECL